MDNVECSDIYIYVVVIVIAVVGFGYDDVGGDGCVVQ